MKKILFMLVAVVALLASCDNDDITISSTTNVRVNPRGVISPFTYKVHPDDLESFDNDYYQLRIRVLAYDEDGVLKAQGIQYATNYNVTQNIALNLPVDHTYTLVAITDLAGKSNSSVSEFWHLSDSSRLATTKVSDAGYIGGDNKILGVGTSKVTVGNESQEIAINPEPAGALIYVEFDSIHAYSSVNRWTLGISKTSANILFDDNGKYVPSVESNNGDFKWRLAYLEPDDYEDYDIIYGYYFILPMNNIGFMLQYRQNNDDEDQDLTGTRRYMNLEAGKQYAFFLNMKDPQHNGNIMVYYNTVTDDDSPAKRITSRASSVPKVNGNSYYLSDIIDAAQHK